MVSIKLDYEMLSSEVEQLECKDKNRTPYLCRVKVRVHHNNGQRDFIGQTIFYPESEGDFIKAAEELAISRALNYADMRFERGEETSPAPFKVNMVEETTQPVIEKPSPVRTQQAPVEVTVNIDPQNMASKPVSPVAQSDAERKLNGAMKLNDLWDEITDQAEDSYEEAMTSLAKACNDLIGKKYVPMDPSELEEISLEDLLALHKEFRKISKRLAVMV